MAVLEDNPERHNPFLEDMRRGHERHHEGQVKALQHLTPDMQSLVTDLDSIKRLTRKTAGFNVKVNGSTVSISGAAEEKHVGRYDLRLDETSGIPVAVLTHTPLETIYGSPREVCRGTPEKVLRHLANALGDKGWGNPELLEKPKFAGHDPLMAGRAR